MQSTLQTKEVIALDADDHLVRPTLIRFNVSELRMFQTQVDGFNARHFAWLVTV